MSAPRPAPAPVAVPAQVAPLGLPVRQPEPALAPEQAPAQAPPAYLLYQPATLAPAGPVRLVVALHGMGGDGLGIAQPFFGLAESHGWLLAAPTFDYGDWHDPIRVRSDDIAFGAALNALIADVPRRSGRQVLPGAFLIGFSRGAQLADRYAFFHPEHLAAVASLSAGTYTLPQPGGDLKGDGGQEPLLLPFGTADMPAWLGHPLDLNALRQVPFWLSVGADDTNPADLPPQWDGLLGKTRVSRAQAFRKSLEAVGVKAKLAIIDGAKHELTAAMAHGVDQFLSGI